MQLHYFTEKFVTRIKMDKSEIFARQSKLSSSITIIK